MLNIILLFHKKKQKIYYCQKNDSSIFTIGTLGFDNGTLKIELECLLQHLAFSGSFSTFYELLEEFSQTIQKKR